MEENEYIESEELVAIAILLLRIGNQIRLLSNRYQSLNNMSSKNLQLITLVFIEVFHMA